MRAPSRGLGRRTDSRPGGCWGGWTGPGVEVPRVLRVARRAEPCSDLVLGRRRPVECRLGLALAAGRVWESVRCAAIERAAAAGAGAAGSAGASAAPVPAARAPAGRAPAARAAAAPPPAPGPVRGAAPA